MKRYFIYACELSYGGLHGINDFGVFEFDDTWTEDEIYKEYVVSMSFGVMESYGEIVENLVDEEWFDTEEEYYSALEDAMYENVDGYVVKVKDNVNLTTKELDKICCQLGPEEFREKYCED